MIILTHVDDKLALGKKNEIKRFLEEFKSSEFVHLRSQWKKHLMTAQAVKCRSKERQPGWDNLTWSRRLKRLLEKKSRT